MHARNQFRSRAIRRIVLQKQFSCVFIEGGFGVRVDEETLDGDEDVGDAVGGLPVFLEGIDTDFAGGGDVGVEYLCHHCTFGWSSRKLFRKPELDSEIASGVWGALWTLNDSNDIKHVIVVRLDSNTLRRALLQLGDLPHEAAHSDR